MRWSGASRDFVTAGPKLFPISPTYYAVYFEDPCGNAYEIVYRLN